MTQRPTDERDRAQEDLLSKSFTDIEVGDETTTIGRTITEADVVGYANATGCWIPLHTDRAFAEESMYGGRVVQGTFLVGIAEGLLYGNQPTAIRANAGIDEVRFEQPVYLDDTVHFEASVTDKRQRDDGFGLVTVQIEGYNQRDQRVVQFTCRYLLMLEAETDD